MMCDGVIPLVQALRPLGLSGPSTRAWRQEGAGSRPRRICVTRGLARTGKPHAGANASSPSSRSVW
jgi:hypothetical protein